MYGQKPESDGYHPAIDRALEAVWDEQGCVPNGHIGTKRIVDHIKHEQNGMVVSQWIPHFFYQLDQDKATPLTSHNKRPRSEVEVEEGPEQQRRRTSPSLWTPVCPRRAPAPAVRNATARSIPNNKWPLLPGWNLLSKNHT